MKFALLFFFFSSTLICRGQDPVFYNYRSNNGLPSDEVYNVRTDSLGYLWFATDRGVARFDGNHFTTYSVNDGIEGNLVNDIFTAPNGDVWIVADAKRLYRFTGNGFTAYPWNHLLAKICKAGATSWITQVQFENNFPAWFSIRTGGLLYIGANGQYRYDTLQYKENTLVEDNERKLALFFQLPDKIKRQGNAPISFYFKNKKFIASSSVLSVYLRRKNGHVLASLGNQLFEIKNNELLNIFSYKDFITNLYEDDQQQLWVTEYGAPAKVYPPGAFPDASNARTYFPSANISSMLQDREGGYWFSSYENGVFYVPHNRMLPVQDGLLQSDEIFQEILGAANGKVYAATSRSRIFEIDSNQQLHFIYSGPDQQLSHNCNDLLYDTGSNTIYGCFSRGIFMYNTGAGKTATQGISGRSVLPQEKGFTILGPMNLFRDNVAISSIFGGGTFFCIYQLPENKILIGSEIGLLQYDGNAYTPVFGSVINKRVTAIKKLDNGWLLASTLGKGLFLLKGQQLFQVSLGTTNSANMVNDIAVNGNTVWAATEAGITKADLTNPEKAVITIVSADNRFPYTNTRKIACQHGRIYALAQNKLIVFPADYPLRTQAPVTWLQQVQAGDSVKIDPAHPHKFSFRDRRIRFLFNAVCYSCGSSIRYQYRLLGLHDQWYTTSQPFVEYLSLTPGHYTFEVKTVTAGNISSVPTSYSFSIPKPYWLQLWFILPVLLITIIAAGWLVSLRLKNIQARSREKELLLTKEQVALSAQISPHFIFNSLNSIQHLIIQEDRKQAALHMAAFSRLMRLSLDNSRKKWVFIREEVELLRLYMELESLRFKDKFTCTIAVSEELMNSSLRIPSMLVQPYVENAIHHGVIHLTNRKGMITITLSLANSSLQAAIEDNGIGREKAGSLKNKNNSHQSAGMQISEERLRLLCAETGTRFLLDITDVKDAGGMSSGTKVQFNMPYLNRL